MIPNIEIFVICNSEEAKISAYYLRDTNHSNVKYKLHFKIISQNKYEIQIYFWT